ncbi:MAG: Zn-dependent hydrolase [Natronohydrobacter sp.]|nr:Zn-dependent hydrolase [Natronohydrobacter sp.]
MTHSPPVIDSGLLLSMLDTISQFGATGDGGLDRQAGSTDHGHARDWFRECLTQMGYETRVDAIGNVFGLLQWAGPDAPTVLTGSHLDSQPRGGRFDGTYGVLAGLCAIEAVRRHAQETGTAPKVNLGVVDWFNEEGARFQPSLLGSSVYTGEMELAYALSRRDGDGLSVEEELTRTGYLGHDKAPQADAYIEFHVEGNTELEESARHIGPFARYWGAYKFRVAMIGEKAHTGPTAMHLRKDAGLGAAYVMAGLRAISDARNGTLYTSVGRLVLEPNSPNMVPDRATMFIELRSPDPDALDAAENELMELLQQSSRRAAVSYEVLSVDKRHAGAFDARLVALTESEAAAAGLATLRLDTIGGHDAVPLSRKCPAIVVAVPSVGGILHHPAEFTHPHDLVNGANILARMLARLNACGGDLDAGLAASEVSRQNQEAG